MTRFAHIVATAAVGAAALVAAPLASAHDAAGTATCTEATFTFDRFPVRPYSDVYVEADVDGTLAAIGDHAAPGPRIVVGLPLSLAGDHVVSLYAWWVAPDQQVPRHLIATVPVSCAAPIEPPPAEPPATPVPPAAPAPPVAPAPPPAIAPPPPAAVQPPPRRVVRRTPARARYTCPPRARWRARPHVARQVVRVRGWWYYAGCQPELGNRITPAVTG
jgi:hypothetical protein